MSTARAILRLSAFLLFALALPAPLARAQSDAAKDYPNRPVRLVVGLAAGGGVDTTFLQSELAKWAEVVKAAGLKAD